MMEWDIVMKLLDPKLAIVLVACWILGYILKRTPRIPDWSIVYIVTLCAIAFAVSILGPGPLSLLQGILCGAVAVYGHQLLKQAKEKVDEV